MRALFLKTDTFGALVRWVAALHCALPEVTRRSNHDYLARYAWYARSQSLLSQRCECFWENEVLVAFAYDTGCRLGAQVSHAPICAFAPVFLHGFVAQCLAACSLRSLFRDAHIVKSRHVCGALRRIGRT